MDEALARRLQAQEMRAHAEAGGYALPPSQHLPYDTPFAQQQQAPPPPLQPISAANPDAVPAPPPGMPSWVVPQPGRPHTTHTSNNAAVEGFKMSMRDAGLALKRLGSGIKRWARKAAEAAAGGGASDGLQQQATGQPAAGQPQQPAQNGAVVPAVRQQQPVALQGAAPAPAPALPSAASQQTDEELARRLQAQFDAEHATAAAAQQAALRQPPQLPAAPPPGGGTGLPGGSAQLALPVDSSHCTGCGKSVMSLGALFSGRSNYITALGRSYHPECFRCRWCEHVITPEGGGGVQFCMGPADGAPYHPACHRQAFHPRCCVCAEFVPTQPGGRIVWTSVPFWDDRFCPAHADDGTPRCTACTRLQPRDAEWASLQDGRALCLPCMDTVVVGNEEAQARAFSGGGSGAWRQGWLCAVLCPCAASRRLRGAAPLMHTPPTLQAIFTNVLNFFAKIGLGLSIRPPMMLVRGSRPAATEPPLHLPQAAPRPLLCLRSRRVCWRRRRDARRMARAAARGQSSTPGVRHAQTAFAACCCPTRHPPRPCRRLLTCIPPLPKTGLCLTEEWTEVRTVLRMPSTLNPFAIRAETVPVATTAVVKAILVCPPAPGTGLRWRCPVPAAHGCPA